MRYALTTNWTFWEIDSYSMKENLQQGLIPPSEKQALNILEQSTTFKEGHFQVLCCQKMKILSLSNNREMTLNLFYLLEKLLKNPQFKSLHQKHEYTESNNAGKWTNKEANETSSIANYLLDHGLFNINKPGKMRVVFDASAKLQITSLNENLLSDLYCWLTCLFWQDFDKVNMLWWQKLNKCVMKLKFLFMIWMHWGFCGELIHQML